jgi:hypothetical protein
MVERQRMLGGRRFESCQGPARLTTERRRAMIAILYVFALVAIAWSINWELKAVVADLLWIARLVQLESDFAFWWDARKSPIMLERLVARQVLRESFVVVRM